MSSLTALLLATSMMFALSAPVFADSSASGGATGLSEQDAPKEGLQDTPKTFNLRIRPLGLIFGIFGGELQVGVTPWLALGASIDWFQYTNSGNTLTFTAFEYGALASIYFTGTRFNGGWLVQPGYRYAPTNNALKLRDSTFNTPAYDYYLTTTVGYEWAWRSGFNVHLGGGLASDPKDPTREIEPLAVWQLGFAI